MKTNPLEDGTFLLFNIRLDKVKEMHIYRSYLNIPMVAA